MPTEIETTDTTNGGVGAGAAEMVGDVLRRQPEDVPGVPGEVVARAGVLIDVAQAGRGADAVSVMDARPW